MNIIQVLNHALLKTNDPDVIQSYLRVPLAKPISTHKVTAEMFQRFLNYPDRIEVVFFRRNSSGQFMWNGGYTARDGYKHCARYVIGESPVVKSLSAVRNLSGGWYFVNAEFAHHVDMETFFK